MNVYISPRFGNQFCAKVPNKLWDSPFTFSSFSSGWLGRNRINTPLVPSIHPIHIVSTHLWLLLSYFALCIHIRTIYIIIPIFHLLLPPPTTPRFYHASKLFMQEDVIFKGNSLIPLYFLQRIEHDSRGEDEGEGEEERRGLIIFNNINNNIFYIFSIPFSLASSLQENVPITTTTIGIDSCWLVKSFCTQARDSLPGATQSTRKRITRGANLPH